MQALIHCPRLNKLSLTDCPQLECLMLWSDELTELDLSGGHSTEQHSTAHTGRWTGCESSGQPGDGEGVTLGGADRAMCGRGPDT